MFGYPAANSTPSADGALRSFVVAVRRFKNRTVDLPTPGGVEYRMIKRRKSSLSREGKQDVLNRLKSVRGHLDGIVKMVEDDTYCVQVIKQVAAVRGALDRVSRLELQNHLEHCVVEQVQAGDGEAAVAELMDIVNLRQEVA